VRATVDAGGLSTSYARAGTGLTVVLLASDATLGTWLLATLAEHCRVFLPETPAGHVFPEWLRGFLDGLGLGRVSFVATDELAAPVLGFAASDIARVERLVLLQRDVVHPLLVYTSPTPLLVRHLSAGSVSDILSFLPGAAS
jgi:hypothetical protein